MRRLGVAGFCGLALIVGAGLAGSAAAGARATEPLAHAAATFINGYQNELVCESASECTAVAPTGLQLTFNPTRGGKVIQSRPVKSTGDYELGIACPLKSLCVMADAYGNAAAFDPKNPKRKPARFSVTGHEGQTDVSCPSKTRCVIETYQGVAVFHPAHPGSPKTASFSANGNAISPNLSCPSTTRCDGDNGVNGLVYTYNPLKPAAVIVTNFNSTPETGDNDCISTKFCVALAATKAKAGESSGSNLGVMTYNPSKPGNPKVTAITQSTLEILTCESNTLCAAGGNNGGIFIFDPRKPKRQSHFVAFPASTDTIGISFINSSKLVILSNYGKTAAVNPLNPPKSVTWSPMRKAIKVATS